MYFAVCCVWLNLLFVISACGAPLLRTVVTKSTLAPYACSTVNGVSTMIAEPSSVCSRDDQAYARMTALAKVMIVLFVLGVPMGFLAVLLSHRRAITADQFLRIWGEGDSVLTNAHIRIRQRFRKLYEVVCSSVE